MKTKTKKKPEISSEDVPEKAPVIELQPEATSKPNGKIKERFQISFDLNEDGSPDLSSMRDKTKEKVKQFFSDPSLANAFGAKPADVSAIDFFPVGPGQRYSPIIGSMYNTLGMIEGMIAGKMLKIPAPLAMRAFTYTEDEKALLAPYTARVLNKYAPDWLIRFQDEIALANLIVSITFAKAQAAIMIARASAAMPPAPAAENPEEQKPAPN